MIKDKIKKEIDILVNERNHLWNALIVTIGGTLALMFNLTGFLSYLLIIIGIILSCVFFSGYFNKGDLLKKLLNKLEEVK